MSTVLGISRTRLIVLACLALAGYFTYTAVNDAIRNQRLEASREQALQELYDLQQERAYLEAVRDYVGSDEYVEQVARRELGYVRPGEVPFVVVSPPLAPDDSDSGTWWERLFPR